MTFVQLKRSSSAGPQHIALFDFGFRLFFLGGAIFSVVSVLFWMAAYTGKLQIDTAPISLFQWHAHQMIYGFAIAVIAGFLLTAISNWTGIQTIKGKGLIALFLFWMIPRLALLFGIQFIVIAAIFEALFYLLLIYSVTSPIVVAKQWKQLGILLKVILLAIGNLCFYLDVTDKVDGGAFIGIYTGLFLVVSLILTIGGRVMPSFIRNGLDYDVDIKNPRWVAILTLVFFLSFSINYIFINDNLFSATTALLLFVLTTYRLYCWYSQGIWRAPLLWSLYCAYIFIDLAFLIIAVSSFVHISPYLAIHAFAYGAIGLSTLSMMSRVTLGHTGRNIRTPPFAISIMFITFFVGAIVRTVIPLLHFVDYTTVIVVSQFLWVVSFSCFILIFAKMLIFARVDGLPG